MHLMNHVLLTDTIESFNETYKRFLAIMELADESVVKVGFYTGALEMVRRNPIPENDVQVDLVKYLEQTLKDSIGELDDDLMGTIAATYQTVARDRLEKHHQGHTHEILEVGKTEWTKWMR